MNKLLYRFVGVSLKVNNNLADALYDEIVHLCELYLLCLKLRKLSICAEALLLRVMVLIRKLKLRRTVAQ